MGDRAAACVVLKVDDGWDDGWIVGKGLCKKFDFPPISDLDVAQELALKDADDKLTRWLSSLESSLSRTDLERIRSRVKPIGEGGGDHGPLYVKTVFGFASLPKMMDVAQREISKSLG
ncbi:MAG: hypothetical protein ACRDK3_00455 [Actinomycetota bacterium]